MKTFEFEEHEGCHISVCKKTKGGYPYVWQNGKTALVHRLQYQRHHFSENILGKVVMHTCDNPSCINPEHLVLGTQKDNLADMFAKGRNSLKRAHGENAGGSKLKEEEARYIRDNPDHCTQKELAKRFGVHKHLVYLIQKRKLWRDLP